MNRETGISNNEVDKWPTKFQQMHASTAVPVKASVLQKQFQK